MSKASSFKQIPEGALTALAALQRAAVEARRMAIQTNSCIVISRDGKPLELSAADLISERDSQIIRREN